MVIFFVSDNCNLHLYPFGIADPLHCYVPQSFYILFSEH